MKKKDISSRPVEGLAFDLCQHIAESAFAPAIFVVNPEAEYQLLHASRACQYFGINFDAQPDMLLTECIPTLSVAQLHTFWQLVGKSGRASMETEYHMPTGQHVAVELTFSQFEHAGQQMMAGYLRDITERRKTEQEINFMNFSLNQMHDAVFLADSQFRFRYVNDRACQSLGYSREELLTMGVLDIDPGVNNVMMQAIQEQTFEQGYLRVETSHRTREGHVFPVEISVTMFEFDGESMGLAVARDISERRQYEDILRKKRQFLTEAQRIAHVGSWELDLEANVLTWSEEVFHIFEIDQGQFAATYEAFIAAIHPDDREAVNRAYTESLETRQPYVIEHRLLMADGRVKYVQERCETQYAEDGAQLRSLGTVQDITERKRMEQEFRNLAESSPNSIIRYDRAGRIRYLNIGLARAMGVSAAEVLGKLPSEAWPDGRYDAIQKAAAEAVEMETEISIELCAKSAGEADFYQIHVVPERDAAGQVIGTIAFGVDITDLKRYTQSLLEQAKLEAHISGVAASVPGFIFTIHTTSDRHVSFPFASAGIEELLGLRPEDIRSDAAALRSRYHPEDLPRVLALMDETEKTLAPFRIEIRIIHPERGMRWIEIRSMPQRREDGSTEWHGLMIDITERKQHGELLAFMGYALDHVREAIYLIDENDRFVQVNEEACRALGYTQDELLGMQILDIDPDFGPEHLQQRRDEIKAGVLSRIIETRHRAKDGRIFPVEVNANFISYEGYRYTMALVRDISERKQAEVIVLQREQEFRALAENSPDPIYRYDRDCRRLYVNSAVGRMLGRPVDELIGSTPADGLLFVSEQSRKLMEGIRQVFTSGENGHLDIDFIAFDGRHHDYQMLLVPERDDAGEVVTVLGMARDITSIRDVERRLTNFVANFPGFAYTFRLSPDGHFSFPFASPGIEKLYGLQPSDVQDDMAPLHALAHPDDRPRIEAVIAEAARTMAPIQMEFRVCRPGLPERWLEARSQPMMEADGSIVWHGLMLDITERKRAHEIALRYQEIFENVTDGVFVLDVERDAENIPHFRFAEINPAMVLMGKLYQGNVLGRYVEDCVPEDAARKMNANYRRCVEAGKSIRYDFELEYPGGMMYFESVLIPMLDNKGSVCRLICVTRDIAERKRMEAELVGQAEFQQSLLTSMYDVGMQVMVVESGRIIHIGNRALARQFGYTDAELDASPALMDIIHPDDRALAMDYHQRRLAGEAVPANYELGLVTRNGERHEYEVSAAIVPSKYPVRIVTIGRDITEQVHLRQALAASEREFRALAENSLDPIYRYDRDCRRLYVNSAVGRMLGRPVDELIGSTPADGLLFVSEQNRKLMEGIRQVFTSGENGHLDIDFIAFDGRHHDYQMLLVPERDDAGEVVTVLGMARDITSIRDVERRLTNFVANFPGFAYTFRLSPDGHFSFPFASPGIEKLYGLTPADVQDDMAPIHNLAHPDDQPRIEAAIVESARTMAPFHMESRVCRSSQPERWIEVRSVPMMEADGSIEWHGLMIDITERKRVEAERQHLLDILAQSSDFIGQADLDGALRYHNRAALRMVGLPDDADISGMRIADMHPEWAGKLIEETVLPTLLEKNIWRGESALLHRDGHEIPVSQLLMLHRDTEGKPLFTSTIMTDITEQKRTEETLQRSLSALEEAQRIGHIGSWDVDMVNDVLTWSDEIFRIWEIDKTQFRATFAAFLETVHPEDRGKVTHAYNQSISDKSLYQVEHRLLLPDGRVKYIHERGEPHFDDDGRPIRFIGTALDITERKQFEMRLVLQDYALNHVGEAIYLIDEDARILQANDAASQMLGYSQDELLSLRIYDLDPDFVPKLWRQHWNDLLMKSTILVETNHRTKAGHLIPIEVHANFISHEGRHYNFALVRDITERQNSQHLLRQLAARSELAREDERKSLAREVHDELGQYLMAIRMNMIAVDLAFGENNPALQEEVSQLIALLDTTIQVVRNIVVSLRPSVLDMGVVPALEWLVDEYQRRTEIQCALQITDEDIDLDDKRATAVFRIVQESLTNIGRHSKASEVKIVLRQKENQYELEVRDNGKGFDPAVRKVQSFGLLGMRERVITLGGELEIASAPGCGTVIKVSIPVNYVWSEEE